MSHRAFDGYTAPQTGNGINGSTTAIKAQNATGTGANGGDLVLSSGKGTNRDGYVRLQVGGQNVLAVTPTGFEISISEIKFDGYVIAPTIRQANMPNAGVDGYNLTIKAQSSAMSPARGGNLILRSGDGYNGDGYFRDGYINLFSGGIEQARVVSNKFATLTGQRVNVTNVSTSPFEVSDGYYLLMVDTSVIPITVNLPITPAVGDVYQVKDKTGNSSAQNLIVSGNGKNIDGAATYLININYAMVSLVYNGANWSIL